MAFTLTSIPHEVRACEGSGILPYLQANKPACYYFMGDGRTQETPMLETEDLITHSTASSVSMRLVSTPHVLQVPQKGQRWV